MLAKYCYKYKLTVETKCKLFDILIEPVFSHGAELWGFSRATRCESVHLCFLKDLLCLKSMTHSEIVYAECKRIPLIYLRYIKIILFWLKLVSNDNDMPCCEVYKNMLPINNVWRQRVIKELLYKLGFDYVWLAGGPGNHKAFMSDFKERIYDLVRRNLYDNILVARKCEIYMDICPYLLDCKWPNYHVLGLSKPI